MIESKKIKYGVFNRCEVYHVAGKDKCEHAYDYYSWVLCDAARFVESRGDRLYEAADLPKGLRFCKNCEKKGGKPSSAYIEFEEAHDASEEFVHQNVAKSDKQRRREEKKLLRSLMEERKKARTW